jgi:hypothetical protein
VALREWAPGVRRLAAACVVLFPLTFIVLAGTGVHPNAGLGAGGIQQVAEAADRWRYVHAGLAVGALFGLGTVLVLRALAVDARPSGLARWLTEGFTVIAASGAAMLSGVLLMEVGLVAPLAEACAGSSSCLSDAPFAARVAELGWAAIPPLGWAGILLTVGLLGLAVTGWVAGGLRWWEGLTLTLAAVGIGFTNPGYHGDAMYPLLFALIALAGVAGRLLWPAVDEAAHPAATTFASPGS